MAFGISDTQLTEIKNIIFKNKNVDEAIVFGSRAIGNHKPGSDIDNALKGISITSMDAADIQFELEETYLPYFFDVIAFTKIDNSDLIDHINRVGKKIF